MRGVITRVQRDCGLLNLGVPCGTGITDPGFIDVGNDSGVGCKSVVSFIGSQSLFSLNHGCEFASCYLSAVEIVRLLCLSKSPYEIEN